MLRSRSRRVSPSCKRAEPLVVGAAGDQVAGVQRHDRRGELDELRHPVLHVVGVVIVAQLAVVPEAHDDIVGLGDLVGGGDARADRGEGVEGFAEPAAGLPGAPPLAARRHVDQAGIAEHRAAPIRRRHLLRRPLDDQRQLGLVHEDPRLGEFGQHGSCRRARPPPRGSSGTCSRAAPRAARAPSNWRCSTGSCRAAAGAGTAAPDRAAPPRPSAASFSSAGRSRSNPSMMPCIVNCGVYPRSTAPASPTMPRSVSNPGSGSPGPALWNSTNFIIGLAAAAGAGHFTGSIRCSYGVPGHIT